MSSSAANLKVNTFEMRF